MPWLTELAVPYGRVWFKPSAEEGTYTVEALLECAEQFKVWFQDIEREIPYADPKSTRKHKVQDGRIALASRLEPDIPVPDDLLELCRRLLSPEKERGEQWYGYVFSAHLPLDIGETLEVSFRDTTFWGRDATFVEFARFEEPCALVAHERYEIYGEPFEDFEVSLRLKCGWPLA